MITVTDIFAGAGGSSTGGISVRGIEIVMAANHWQLAVDTHNANHPTADHACVDLHLEDPRYFPKTDVLWASPECTKWSQANSKNLPSIEEGLFEDPDSDDAATRSRLLMFDVLRFVEHHEYPIVVVENVIDIATQPKYSLAWQTWRRDFIALGYSLDVISLNSMHAQHLGLPAPQSRDRIYIIATRHGVPVPDVQRFMRPQAYCTRCDLIVESFQAWKPGRTVGRYRQQYVYLCSTPGCGNTVEPGWLPAAAAIDWTIPGKRIGDREKPLAEKTRKRIAAGIARYWGPLQLEAAGQTYDAADPNHASHGDPNAYYRVKSTDDVLGTLHTTASKAVAVPLLMTNNHSNRARPVGEELPTLTTANTQALLQPFLTVHRGEDERTQPLDQPFTTQTASSNHNGLVRPPFITELRGGGSTARPTSHPMSTVTASGNHHGLLAPYYGSGSGETARSSDDPIGTLTTVDRYALIMRNNTARGDQGQMSTPAHEVLRTLTSAGHQSLLTPGDVERASLMVDDCMFRMLEPSEVAAGMAFPSDYLWAGSRRDRVRMAGNAVTPPASRDIFAAIVEALTGEEATAA
jgi:DNA (cytosine-5)-methyltransferase 1